MNHEAKINEILGRGVVNIIPNQSKLVKLLMAEKRLNIYLGIDPTATRLHIGHAVPLRKLQAFAELGHNIAFLIGDFTALIGDTSDKDKERPMLTYDQIKDNFATYKKQAEKILDYDKIKVVFNSEWLNKLNFPEIVKLCQHFSVGDFVGRTLIKNRLEGGKRVALHEMLYPVMQGYDSYHLNTDIQIGAADQTFNMQAGRTLQKDMRKKESFVLVTDYLEGTDGKKMSKTEGNAIWLEDDPVSMYGKVMSLNDELIEQYFILATNLELDEVKKTVSMSSINPMKAKKKLAHTIVSQLHSSNKADEAQEYFIKTFQDKSPEYDNEVKFVDTLLELVATNVGSKTQAKRLIADSAVKVNENVVNNPTYGLEGGEKVKIGKKTFVKVGYK